jgi:hypothetical protein
VEGCCEYGNEPSCSIKYWETLECLSNWPHLKKGSMELVGWFVNFAIKDTSVINKEQQNMPSK